MTRSNFPLTALLLVVLALAACGGAGAGGVLPTPAVQPVSGYGFDPAVWAPGQRQQMTVALNAERAQQSSLRLEIRYPGGREEILRHTAYGNVAYLQWTVPADAGRGQAIFTLTVEDCGCLPVGAPGPQEYTVAGRVDVR